MQFDLQQASRFNIGTSGQQVHVGIGTNEPDHDRHPCFHIDSIEGLNELRAKIWEHHVKGGPSAALAADKPGESDSGSLL
jgi:hypothetical protein